MKSTKLILAFAACFAASALTTHAQVVITEVDANGSSSAYGADWFEIQNIGSTTVSLAGWKMDDNSDLFANAVALRGPTTSLAPGQIAIFLEGNTTGTTDSTIGANFQTAWWGANPLPSNLSLGFYGGSGVGLGGGGDHVNLFDGSGTLMANVIFGASSQGQTFDNSAGLNNTTLTQISQVGADNAFTSAGSTPFAEVGSPSAVPEPSSLALFGMGATALGMLYRRKSKTS